MYFAVTTLYDPNRCENVDRSFSACKLIPFSVTFILKNKFVSCHKSCCDQRSFRDHNTDEGPESSIAHNKYSGR